MKVLLVLAALVTVGCSSSTAPSPVAPTLPKTVVDCTLVGILPCQQPPPVTPDAPKPPPGQTTATVRGTVTDGTSGGILPNIAIAASSGTTVRTDAAGQFQIASVPIGPLTLIVTADSYIRQAVTKNIAADQAVDIVLQRVPAPPPPPPPPPPVPPVTIPTPTPTPPANVFATVAICIPAAHGLATGCNVTVSFNGALVPSAAITSVAWDMGDGFTTTTVPPTAPIVTHVYTGGGVFPVFVTVTATVNGQTLTATSSTIATIP